MKKTTFVSFSYIFTFIFILCVTEPVLAHGSEPRLEIKAERLNPGSLLEIRGVDFELEEEINLVLAGAQAEISLGTVTADTQGVFLLTLALPVDLAAGTYAVRATTEDHVVNSPPIVIWGTAVVENEEEGRRAEEEALLAPMPTFAPGTSSMPLPQQMALEIPVSNKRSPALIYLILFGVGVIALVSLAILRKR